MFRRRSPVACAIGLLLLHVSSIFAQVDPEEEMLRPMGKAKAGSMPDSFKPQPEPAQSSAISLSLSSVKSQPSRFPVTVSSASSTLSKLEISSPSLVPNSSTLSVSQSTRTSSAIATSTSGLVRRDADPSCLKSTEASCYNLAANCIDSVNFDNRNNLWGIRSCAVAATCYGVGDLLTSVRCQTGFNVKNADQASINYNLYAAVVGSCAWAPGGCPVTQQNYIDWYYGTLSLINTGAWPSSPAVVIAFWSAIVSWAATGSTVPYVNLNDWYHYSSYPTTTTTTSTTTTPTYTAIPFNPNSVPSPGAVSQTFIASTTTVVIPIPTVTTTITVGTVSITIAPGGTPVGGLVPTSISQPGAVAPTFNYNPIIPSTASSVTFVSGTWTSIVAAPTSTDSPITVEGPPDDGDDDDDNDWWLLALLLLGAGLFGPGIIGSLPASVSVIGATIPAAVPPADWTDPDTWVPPQPPPGADNPPEDPEDPEDPEQPQTCTFRVLPTYGLSYDGDDDDAENTDALTRRSIDYGMYGNGTEKRSNITELHRLFKRAQRSIVLGSCEDGQNKNSAGLGVATFYTINPPGQNPPIASAATTLHSVNGATHVAHDGKVKEHLFEFRYIRDFFSSAYAPGDCAWMRTNAWNYILPDGRPLRQMMIETIDSTLIGNNMVWSDLVLNQAKSSVANNFNGQPNNPPQKQYLLQLTSLDANTQSTVALQIETFIRALGALGAYYNTNSAAFHDVARAIQTAFARVTPTSPTYPPMDRRWNDFLRNLFQQYPNRIRDRGVNLLNAYRAKINGIVAAQALANPPPAAAPVVPACWPVYHDPNILNALNNAGNILTWANMVPAPISHPLCNTAGTTGHFNLYRDGAGNPLRYTGIPTWRINALGSQYYAWELLPNPTRYFFWDVDLGQVAKYNVNTNICNGIHNVRLHATGFSFGTQWPLAFWTVGCRGAVTGSVLADMIPVDQNGTPFGVCRLNDFLDNTGRSEMDCGPTENAVRNCINHMNVIDNNPNGKMRPVALQLEIEP